MKRSTWVVAGALVSTGLLLLLTAGLGLHSRSMMGRVGMMGMGRGNGMMSTPAMIWSMGLWAVFIILLFLVSLIGLLIISYRLTKHSSRQCLNCHAPVQKDWTYCPKCGSVLADKSRKQ